MGELSIFNLELIQGRCGVLHMFKGRLPVVIAGLITLLIWASTFPMIRFCLRVYSPLELAVLRLLIATVALTAYNWRTGVKLPKSADLYAIAITGIVGFPLYYLLLNYGQLTISSTAASILVNTAPIFTAIFAVSFLKERLKSWQAAGILLSFIGAVGIGIGESQDLQIGWGAMLVMASAVCISVFFILQKPLLKYYSAHALMHYAMGIGTIALLPALPSALQTITYAPWQVTLGVAYLGLFSTAIAYTTWSYLLSQVNASRAVILLYLVPALTTLIAWFWLGEMPSIVSLGGTTIILAGVALVRRD